MNLEADTLVESHRLIIVSADVQRQSVLRISREQVVDEAAADAHALTVQLDSNPEEVHARHSLFLAEALVNRLTVRKDSVANDGAGVALLSDNDFAALRLPELFHDEPRVGLAAVLECLAVDLHERREDARLRLLGLFYELDDDVVDLLGHFGFGLVS